MTHTPHPPRETAPDIALAQGVHFVTRPNRLSATLAEQAAIVIAHRDARQRYILTVLQPGEAPREVHATFSEVPQDGTFHLIGTTHAPLAMKSRRLIF